MKAAHASDPLPRAPEAGDNEASQAARKPVSYFVASFVPSPAATHLAELQRLLPHDIEPQDPARMHVTWRSFEGLPHGLLDDLKQALAELAARHEPLGVMARGRGCFEGGSIWIGLHGASIAPFQADVDATLDALGLSPAVHPFVPHVTLGRGAPASPCPPSLDEFEIPFTIHEVCLTTTGNAEYRVVRRFPLGRAPA
jgi:2'-5' RNA ligase